ncbi:hypothetical protein [Streptomyces niveus]|uniref:hypothetical protein n=1 Tax=Streptomyces niveus TaxID=193462 RepID=UPI00344A5B51
MQGERGTEPGLEESATLAVAHGLSLSRELIAPQVHAELRFWARTLLPGPLRRLVELTREPLAQATSTGGSPGCAGTGCC